MKQELKDFIYEIPEFNSCIFCKKFGLTKDCPVKHFYKEGENPSSHKIEIGHEMCKNYVLMNLDYLVALN